MIFGRKRIYDLDAVAHTNDDASQTKMLVLQNPGSIDNSENVVAKKMQIAWGSYGRRDSRRDLFFCSIFNVVVPPVHLLPSNGLVKHEKHQKHRERSQTLLTNSLPSELFSSR